MDVFSGSWPLTRVAIIESSPVDHVVGAFYLARHTPPCPTRLFSYVAGALTWLRSTLHPDETPPQLAAKDEKRE